MFKHFIITRYNIRIPGWEKKNNNPALNKDWLDHRFLLFKNYCLPSIIHQTNQNFEWLICLDVNTDESYISGLQQELYAYPHYKIILVDGYSRFVDTVHNHIRLSASKDEFIISTRLDNDDALHKDFIQTIQNNFKHQNKCIVDFPKGICMEVEPQVKLSHRNMKYNAFLSLIEKRENFQTIMYYFQHHKWKKSGAEYLSIKNGRYWLQTVHARNVLNTFKGQFASNNIVLLENFGISLPQNYHTFSFFEKTAYFFKTILSKIKQRITF
ncbi:MAG: hypothetical protein C0594_12510 [Marinilabiliales bacterium]|nr:MAG: hypothetical protein C0594_12510 [Marinilabiliales bacterium]